MHREIDSQENAVFDCALMAGKLKLCGWVAKCKSMSLPALFDWESQSQARFHCPFKTFRAAG